MEEYAMSYEYLIRRVFQCGRYGVAGANADEYRRLERASQNLKNNKSPKVEDVFNYAFECGQICAYLNSAIDKFSKDFNQDLTSKEKSKLDEIKVLIIRGKIPEIQKAIQESENIMIEHKLYP